MDKAGRVTEGPNEACMCPKAFKATKSGGRPFMVVDNKGSGPDLSAFQVGGGEVVQFLFQLLPVH